MRSANVMPATYKITSSEHSLPYFKQVLYQFGRDENACRHFLTISRLTKQSLWMRKNDIFQRA